MMINFNGKIVCEEDFNINYNNRFFLYVMFYHFFGGLAGIFKDD